MKILILTDDFPLRNFGGSVIVTYSLAKALQKRGHSVFIISTTKNKSEAGEIIYEGMKVFNIYSDYHRLFENYFCLYNPRAVGKVKKIIKNIRPDVVHAHKIHFHISYYSLKVARRYCQKVFFTSQDVTPFNCGKLLDFYDKKNLSAQNSFTYKVSVWQHFRLAGKRYNPLRNIIIRHYLKYTDKIFTTSRALKDAFNDNGIKNVEVVYSGIDVKEWAVGEEAVSEFKNKFDLQDKKIVFYGGRLSGAKGAGQIIRAMGKVADKIPDVCLLMAGKKDSQMQELIKLAKNLGIEKKLVFTDWLVGEELKAAYWASDMVVVPSICFDTFPTVNLEAMACKRPVVATCFGGSAEIVQDGVTGYIVNPNNVEVLAEKILGLLRDKNKAEQFGQVGYERVKNNFTVDLQIKKTLAWYNN